MLKLKTVKEAGFSKRRKGLNIEGKRGRCLIRSGSKADLEMAVIMILIQKIDGLPARRSVCQVGGEGRRTIIIFWFECN